MRMARALAANPQPGVVSAELSLQDGRPYAILMSADGSRARVLGAIRDGLGSDLGSSEADEAEHRRRTIEVAKLMSRAGVTVLVALDQPDGEEKPGTEVDVASYQGDWVI